MRLHLPRVLPLPNRAALGTKPLTHGPLTDTYPNQRKAREEGKLVQPRAAERSENHPHRPVCVIGQVFQKWIPKASLEVRLLLEIVNGKGRRGNRMEQRGN